MKQLIQNIFQTALLIGVFSFTINVSGQEAGSHKFGELGFRFMPTFSSLQLSNSTGGTVKGEVTLGYGVGGFVGFNFTDNIGIQGEVIYNSYSQKYRENDIEHHIKLQYLNIPLLLSLNTGKSQPINFNIVGGPQLGISVGSSMETTQNDAAVAATPVFAVKKGDFGLAYGAGLDFGLNPSRTFRLGFGFRGVYGLVDISDHSRSTTTTSYYVLDRTHIKTNSIYVGFSILF